MIPPEKIAAVTQGLREAFGETNFTDICRITNGLSSDLVFRIVARGSPYLLRVMTRIDERNDPVRHFTCMKVAAECGLAPRVLHANTDDGILITDFVEAAPFSEAQALMLIPATLRNLHALPPFPKAFNYVTAHNGFIWRFRTANLVAANEIEEVFTRYDQVCAVYPRLNTDIVSCHSDLKPENILFDGKRVWLVDWQAAFLNDRYFDLAVVANFVITTDADEKTYLEAYFGQPPDEYACARFLLMRQVIHMFYAAVFLMLGSGGKPVKQHESLPTFRNFHQRIWAGGVDLADQATRVVYGRVHWEQLLQNVRQARFEEALGIVSGRHAGQGDSPRLLPAAL
jgi:aminoglycoside phosphotransferase (APT) family kinase protein